MNQLKEMLTKGVGKNLFTHCHNYILCQHKNKGNKAI